MKQENASFHLGDEAREHSIFRGEIKKPLSSVKAQGQNYSITGGSNNFVPHVLNALVK